MQHCRLKVNEVLETDLYRSDVLVSIELSRVAALGTGDSRRLAFTVLAGTIEGGGIASVATVRSSAFGKRRWPPPTVSDDDGIFEDVPF